MNLRQKILTYILSIVLLYAVYFWGIPSIISIDKRIDFIEKIAKDKFGYNIELINPKLKMGLLPSVWVKADEFNILNDDKSKALSIKNPNIEVSILRFLTGKCNIKYFSSDSIDANLSLDKDLRMFLGQYILVKNSEFLIDINHIKLNIQNYRINMHDKTFNKNLHLNGDYLTIDEYIKNKSIKMATSAVLNVDKSKSSINFDLNIKLPWTKNLSDNHAIFTGSITNLNLENLSQYVSYATGNQYKDIKGILNLEAHTDKKAHKNNNYNLNFTFEDFGINGKDFAKKYDYNGRIELISNFSAVGKDLIINNFKFATKDLNVVLSGNIDKITSNSPDLNLVLEIPNSRAESIVALLPANNKLYQGLDFDIETLVKTGFFADVNTKLNIQGDINEPKINGDLKITKAYVTPQPLTNGADKATINLTFTGDRLNMDVFVPAAVNEYVTVEGFAALYGDKTCDIKITSTKNVDLGLAQRILMPVHKVLNFELGPVPVMEIKGIGNIDLRITGNKINPYAYGIFNFSDGTVSFNDIHNMTVNNAAGSLKFDSKNTVFKTKSGLLNGKPININGTCTLDGELNFDAVTKNQQVRDLLKILQTSPMIAEIGNYVKPIKQVSGISDFKLNLTGKVNNAYDIKFGKNIFAKGNLTLSNVSAALDGLSIPVTNVSGKINFENMDLTVDLESLVHRSKLNIEGIIKNKIADININSENMTPQDLLLYFSNSKFLIPKTDRNSQKQGFIVFSSKYKGPLDKIDYTKLNINATATFNNFKFYYIPKKVPVEIVSGNIIIKNDIVGFNNLNARIAGMPIFLKGKAENIYKKPAFNLYINSKPNQNFADVIFNRSEIYPLKIKGDITNSISIKGNYDNYNLKSNIKLSEASRIYYMGASLGDESRPIDINIDANISKNNVNIKSLTMDKLISSQNNRLYPSRELIISGGLNYIKDNIYFKDFRIKTLTPTDSRIFNIIFKKPIIKQGMFNSDIRINGTYYVPKILGTLSISDIDIPNYFVKINNINMNFQPREIITDIQGQALEKNFKIKSVIQNYLKAPYVIEDLNLFIADININDVTAMIKNKELEGGKKLSKNDSLPFDFSSVIIKKSRLQADTIELDNIFMHDLHSKLSLDDKKILSIDEFYFKTAQGKIRGDYKLDLKNNIHSTNVKLSDISADVFSETMFNLKNQISGNLDGSMELTCNGITHEACLKTLSGTGGFSIKNGKMPKLGSLEYLLNAANLVKSGITGLSINSFVDLITPLRTGEFESITGTFNFKDGICNNIQIFSSGKNLNLFIVGKYDLTTMIAEMSVFGRLSKNASNVLGPIGNASLNALFNTIPGLNLSKVQDNYLLDSINKIPGIELSNKRYRIFTADINGDINGDNYVKTFRWIE